MPWTHFYDMRSGGGQKLKWPHIFIEASEAEAALIFYNRFARNPYCVTCTCCGPDYFLREHEDLAQATAYERGCRYDEASRRYIEEEGDLHLLSLGKYQTLSQYLARGEALVIPAKEIEPHERRGTL